jgi:hypothetical protein
MREFLQLSPNRLFCPAPLTHPDTSIKIFFLYV